MAMRPYSEQEETYVLNCSTSGFFSYVSPPLRSHNDHITLVGSSDQRLSSARDICNEFLIEFLIEFYKNFSTSLAITTVASKTERCVFQVDVSMPALLSVIHDMPNSAAGPDDIFALVNIPVFAVPGTSPHRFKSR